MVQGASRGDHFGLRYLHSDGTPARSRVTDLAETWSTLLYQPLGSVAPGARCSGLVGDLVETTGAIDGQSPIPEPVQNLSRDRHFLFLGCRLTEKSNRMFVRQILQRASAPHWAVLTEAPTTSEASFMAEQNIEGIDLPLSDFVAALTELRQEEQAQLLLASW